MIFTSSDFLAFLLVVLGLYWAIRDRKAQNALLLGASYLFYGYVHPWFCLLLLSSTVVDYVAGLEMVRRPARKRLWLWVSLAWNLGLLGIFKYFNFFADSTHTALASLGVEVAPVTLEVMLPVGISFYTFQTLSYTIDVYRGWLEPRRSFLDFALFVSFFPQLVAGPIERAVRFLPQLEEPRPWRLERFYGAFPLLVTGFLKKMVVADNVAIYADQVFALARPSWWMLLMGSLAFTVQIVADFSGYTDIARGCARLLGFELIVNFDKPYLALSPSDFWRRWHISFSSWIRDYLYIPLGGSKVKTGLGFLAVVVTTMGLSGLWHGAAWNFVAWGVYHGLLVFIYHRLGMGGRWKPRGALATAGAWAVMFALTVFGWTLFRTPSMAWLWGALAHGAPGLEGDSLLVGAAIGALTLAWSAPLLLWTAIASMETRRAWIDAVFYALALVLIVLFARDSSRDFIYFQF